MSDILTFNKNWDTSYSNSLLYTQPQKTNRFINEESTPYGIATGTAATKETWLLDQLYFEFQKLIAHTQVIFEPEIPDVFTLQPLSSKRITLRIKDVRPAQFYFVDDLNENTE